MLTERSSMTGARQAEGEAVMSRPQKAAST